MGKGHRVTHLTKNKLGQSGLEEALVKGHGTVSGDFYRLSPLYRIFASTVNIQREPIGSHCAYIDKEEKGSRYSSGEHVYNRPVYNTQFVQKCLQNLAATESAHQRSQIQLYGARAFSIILT